jgi:hypothetical protein
MRRPAAEFFFDEEAIGRDLQTVSVINPPCRGFPFLGNQKIALSYDAVRTANNFSKRPAVGARRCAV